MTRIYPGMLCCSKEYFNSGREVMLIHDGTVKNFDDVPEHPELALIIDNDMKLNAVLTLWFGTDERMKQKQLAKCRFGGLNFYADFNEDEEMADFVVCPHRGSCRGEGIVCKPVEIEGEIVTVEEIALLKEVCTDKPNYTIAQKLGYALGTFNVKKNNLYRKLGFKTKQHAAITMMFEGLL